VVIATEVIEHFFHPMPELTKIARLCRPNGVFCGSTGFSVAGEIEDDGFGYMAARGHVIYWSERSLAKAFEQIGWRLHTFRLASNVPTARLFFGTTNPDINKQLELLAKQVGDGPLLRWSDASGRARND
jgi:Methyltransferase domain